MKKDADVSLSTKQVITSHVEIDFAADAKAVTATDAQVKSIADLADEAKLLEGQIGAVEESLKLMGERYRLLTEVTLPEAMDAANMKTFTTKSGAVVEVGPFLQVSLAGDKLGKACTWLKATGNDGIITRDVVVSFKKGDMDAAEQVLVQLKEQGFEPVDRQAVNTATFKALLRELLAKGTPVPLEELGAYAARRATIKQAKVK